jgi:hypothetical protein
MKVLLGDFGAKIDMEDIFKPTVNNESYAQSLRLEAFECFYVGRGCASPELYSVGPDWFECSFVDGEFAVCREF